MEALEERLIFKNTNINREITFCPVAYEQQAFYIIYRFFIAVLPI